MVDTVKLVALKSMRYGGRSLESGDTFDCTLRDAKTLIVIGRAEKSSSHSVKKKPVKGKAEVSAPVAHEVVAPPHMPQVPMPEVTTEKPTETETENPTDSMPSYLRRDMRAQE